MPYKKKKDTAHLRLQGGNNTISLKIQMWKVSSAVYNARTSGRRRELEAAGDVTLLS